MAGKSTTSSDHVDTEVRPRTATEGRRHRPSSRAEKPAAKAAGKKGPRHAKVVGTGPKSIGVKSTARREDKREAPEEMVTDARPKNLKADKNDKKSKGKSTHELEAQSPTKRPSRKSTRGGANHAKPDSQQRRTTTRAVRSAKVRHEMRGG